MNSEYWIYFGANGPVVYFQEQKNAVIPGLRVVDHSLLVKCEKLQKLNEEAAHKIVTERNDLLKRLREYEHESETVNEMRAERDKARKENEELMKVDYWQDRYNIVLKELNELKESHYKKYEKEFLK